MSIPLEPVQFGPRPPERNEAPYRAYIIVSFAFAIGGGFALALALPLAQAMECDWGRRWSALVQVHGQIQLLGFAGIFVIGMAFRLMPRFSGVPLAYPLLGRAIIPLMAPSLVLRSFAEPAGDGTPRDAALIGSAVLLVAGAAAFAAVVLRTLLRPASKAESTGWFFVLGAISLVVAAILNAWLMLQAVRDSSPLVPAGRESVLIAVQLYGFVLMFIAGVSTRAVAAFTGRQRSAVIGRLAAVTLALGTAMFAAASLRATYANSRAIARAEDVGLLLIALALVSVVWMTGALQPRANRVAVASQLQFLLVRTALAWLAVASLLILWYATRALCDGTAVDSFETDAIRHALTVGVVTMMIVGMGMMILPEFAGRRLQHPHEQWIIIAILIGLNAAVILRIWPAIEGLNWLSSTRYWPMAAAGSITETVVVVFAAMFIQSYLEQRTPGWGAPRSR